MDVQVFRYDIVDTKEKFEEFVEEGEIIEASLELPAGAQILGCGFASRGIILWAAVDVDDADTVLRHFAVVPNGKTIPGLKSPSEAVDFHIATLKIPTGPTFHIFET